MDRRRQTARVKALGAAVGRRLEPLWADRRFGAAAGVGTAALWGVLAGWWTPRGPMTTSEALWSMALSLSVGLVVGLAMRSRWAMAVAPVAFAVVFELVRFGTEGPLVDGFHASTYGVFAFVVGRGFHGLLSWVPMVLGAAVGAGTARLIGRLDEEVERQRRVGPLLRRAVAVLTAVGLVALGLMIARPATTAAILDADGHEVRGSIAELTSVEVDGHDLGMMIRGHSVDNPVLLFLAGGPGGSELGAMRNHLSSLEEHFTVVTWDQRGTGTSYPALDPTGTLTLDSQVSDTLAVTDHLRERFGQDRIYLVGQSWGSTLGVLAVQAARRGTRRSSAPARW